MTKKDPQLPSEILSKKGNSKPLIPYELYKAILERAKKPTLRDLLKELNAGQDEIDYDKKEKVVFT